MKKYIFILLLLFALSANATNYYVSTTGSNSNNGLSSGTAWATLSYACSQVTAGAHTINVAAGTYNEAGTFSLATGVSIVGAGTTTTIIRCTYTFATSSNVNLACLKLSSASPGTNGNQSVSYLTFDGVSTTASRAIVVYNRSNVSIHHCVIKDFFTGGVIFGSSNLYNNSLSAVLEQNNQLYNNTIDNCTDCSGTYNGFALIFITCQQNMLIHDNLLYSNKRDRAHNGNIINAGGFRFRGVKYYNNQSFKPNHNSSWASTACGPNGNWNFHLEIWGNDGGFEIYNNTFTGGSIPVDIAGRSATRLSGGYTFDFTIHDNTFKQNTDVFIEETVAIHLEQDYTTKTLIYNNTFSGFSTSIDLISPNAHDVYVYDNVMYRIKQAFVYRRIVQGPTFTGTIQCDNVNIYRNKITVLPPSGVWTTGTIELLVQSGANSSNFNVYNNTLVTPDATNGTKGISVSVASGLTLTNTNIKNNILCYNRNVGPLVISNSGTISGLHIENNFSYNLANANVLISYSGNAASNYTTANNLPTSNTSQVSPLFVNESTQDYHLQATSTAINNGQIVQIDAVDLPYIGTAPDRGYIEYDGGSTIALGTIILNSNPGVDANSFYAIANVTADGGGIISERGICFSTLTNPTTTNDKVTNGGGLGSFSSYYEPLLSGITYYLRAYCINQTGTAYSNQVSITTTLVTSYVASTVSVLEISSVEGRKAYILSSVDTDGGGTVSERGLVIATTPNPTVSNTKVINGLGVGVYLTKLLNLNSATRYYIRAYAINEAGTAYSSQVIADTPSTINLNKSNKNLKSKQGYSLKSIH